MKWGDDIPAKYDLSSLRMLGTVGEPINPEAWMWYREHIGGDRCPVVDTWWQTETGAIMISPAAGRHRGKPGSAMRPLPGHQRRRRRRPGRQPVPDGGGGFLVLTRAVAVDAAHDLGRRRALHRHLLVAGSRACYFAGDGAKKDDDGDLWLLGRVDDVMIVSGHRISTTEVESRAGLATRRSPRRRSSARPTRPPGRPSCAFVILRGTAEDEARTSPPSCATTWPRSSGPIAKPRQILVVRRAAQDPLRQDHAPAAARRRREPRASATSPRWPTPP